MMANSDLLQEYKDGLTLKINVIYHTSNVKKK